MLLLESDWQFQIPHQQSPVKCQTPLSVGEVWVRDYSTSSRSEEVRHACTNHYKFSALMSLRSRDNVQAKCTELVVITIDLATQEGRVLSV